MAQSATPKEKKPKTIERYGVHFPETPGLNDMMIELAFYARDDLKSGHPKEFHFKNAWMLVWPKTEWNEWMELLIWAWCNYRVICVIGPTSSGKTRTFAYAALLDWLAWPERTATTLTTTKFDALKTRMWGEMMTAIETMRPELQANVMQHFKVTSTSNELKITINNPGVLSDDKFMIQGVAIDRGDVNAGKIRGQKADRRRIVGDEVEDMGDGFYMAVDNARASPDFKAVLPTNPVERLSTYGNWCKPKGGWGTVTPDSSWWETEKPDGVCIHLDGLNSPNTSAARLDMYPYLITTKYVNDIRASHGEDSLQWWMFVRGFFPPDGIVSRVWPSATLAIARNGCTFDYPPQMVASLDPAYETDNCVLTFGEMGRLRDGKPCIKCTAQEIAKLSEGAGNPTKDRQIADWVKTRCLALHIKPENFIMDTTGNGRSVYALLFESWSPLIQKLEYGGEATVRPLRHNDQKPANEEVRYFVSELWFRASFLAQQGILCGFGTLNQKCDEDLASRRYEIKQFGDKKLMVVEPKDLMKKRLGRSPDFGDSLCQFGELLVRKGMLGAGLGVSATQNTWGKLRTLAQKASVRYREQPTSSNGNLTRQTY